MVNSYNTRLVAILSFVGAVLYYQYSQTPSTEAIVQIYEGGKLVNVSLTHEELENYLRLQQLQAKKNQEYKMKAENTSLKSPPPPPAPPPTPPPIKSPEDSQLKSVISKSTVPHLPVLKPSNGSFLDTLDVTGQPKEKTRFLKARLKVLRQRATVLSSECKIRSNLAKPGPAPLIWDTKHTPNVVWCPSYALKYGARQSPVFQLFPPPEDIDERDRVYNNSLRMIVVSHPFTRLIAVYKDKIQKKDPWPKEYKFLKLQRHIIANYRPKESEETSPFPTFSEFIQYVIDTSKKLKTREDWLKNVWYWTPYWAQCNVCASDYSLIVKLETMAQDQKFLSTVADMTELKKLKSTEWRHLIGVSSDKLIKEYMGKITCRQAWDLYQCYQLDYFLFGYNFNEELLDYTEN
ncbi:uncharacterized protein LOC126998105 [Eriocheir sinensis]|uniref:uncharacterized protein LOC126998105 n=1 Tax=Eriocheir sinensis TaxID=95602 RepID=UPI0021C807DB|nr:uncharacterized protein LOC126998105 [Eriocheir sinensis]